MQANCFIDSLFSDINNSISAPALGAGGRGFESRYPDYKKRGSSVKSFSGCSAVRLAHLLWEQGVVGSNPATPTKEKDFDNQ